MGFRLSGEYPDPGQVLKHPLPNSLLPRCLVSIHVAGCKAHAGAGAGSNRHPPWLTLDWWSNALLGEFCTELFIKSVRVELSR